MEAVPITDWQHLLKLLRECLLTFHSDHSTFPYLHRKPHFSQSNMDFSRFPTHHFRRMQKACFSCVLPRCKSLVVIHFYVIPFLGCLYPSGSEGTYSHLRSSSAFVSYNTLFNQRALRLPLSILIGWHAFILLGISFCLKY